MNIDAEWMKTLMMEAIIKIFSKVFYKAHLNTNPKANTGSSVSFIKYFFGFITIWIIVLKLKIEYLLIVYSCSLNEH